MAGFIKAKRAKNLDKPEDKVGMFTARPSGVYDAVIELAYINDSSKSDAQAINLQCKLTDGSKFYTNLWFSGADGNVFSTNEAGVKKFKQGYLLADALVNFATEGECDLFSAETEPTKIKQKRDGKDVNVEVQSLIDLEDLPVKLGLIQTEKYKQNFVDGEYIDTDEIITISELAQVFDEEGFTLNELDSEAKKPAFIVEWESTWKGISRKVKAKKEAVKGLRKTTSETGTTAKSRVAARKGLRR